MKNIIQEINKIGIDNVILQLTEALRQKEAKIIQLENQISALNTKMAGFSTIEKFREPLTKKSTKSIGGNPLNKNKIIKNTVKSLVSKDNASVFNKILIRDSRAYVTNGKTVFSWSHNKPLSNGLYNSADFLIKDNFVLTDNQSAYNNFYADFFESRTTLKIVSNINDYTSFSETIGKVALTVSDDETRFFLTGIGFDTANNTIVATDGKRISKSCVNFTDKLDSIVIVPYTSTGFEKIANQCCILEKSTINNCIVNSVSYIIDDMALYVVCATGEFPNYNRVIPEYDIAKDFILPDADWLKSELKLQSCNCDKTERIIFNQNGDSIAINGRFLLDAIKIGVTKMRYVKTDKAFIGLSPDNITLVIMPAFK